jgi:hypothetical protein
VNEHTLPPSQLAARLSLPALCEYNTAVATFGGATFHLAAHSQFSAGSYPRFGSFAASDYSGAVEPEDDGGVAAKGGAVEAWYHHEQQRKKDAEGKQ